MANERILIAEDSSTQSLRLQYMLATKGYEVSAAVDGADALSQIDQVRPGLIISDIMMPGMNGYELCRRVKADERWRDISVILLTSLTDPEVVIKALQCGADKFITKPYDESCLLTTVANVFHDRRLEEEEPKETMVISYRGQTYEIASSPRQILTLLLSTYETAMVKNEELAAAQNELRTLNHELEDRVQRRTEALALEVAERRQAQEALRESERYVRSILDTTPAIIAVFDMETQRVVSINEAVERILGYPPETVAASGAQVTALFATPERLGGVGITNRLRNLSEGDVVEWEGAVRAAGGQRVILRYRVTPFDVDNSGSTGTLLFVATDITAEHEARAALSHNAAHLQAIMDSQLEPHLVFAAIRDADGQIVDFSVTDTNPAAAAFAGAQQGALIGRLLGLTQPELVDGGAIAAFAGVVETGEPLVLDDVRLLLHGPTAPHRLDVRAVRLGDGVSVTVRDVTARHEAEDALRRRIAELDTLQRMSALLAGPIELETALDSACRQLSQLFEAIWSEVHLLAATPESAEFGGMGCGDEEDDGGIAAAVHAAISGGSPVAGSCAQGQRLLAVPLVAQAETVGVLVIARDPAAAEFSLHDLTVAGMAADLLAAVISAERLHDIETEQATAQERQRLARDLHDAVVQIIYSASLMVEALPTTWEQDQAQGRSDLLVVRRLVRAALAEMRILLFELRPEVLAVDSVQTLLEGLSDALAWRNELAVELDVEEDLILPEEVRTVFYRVAQEALNNSARHSGASEVSVKVALEGEAVRLLVHDDGCGFDAAAETARGVGISVMRERAESIGASLAIASDPAEGTTVTLEWPVPSFEGE